MKRRKKPLRFNPELDTKDFRREQWTEFDDVKGWVNLFELFVPNAEVYLRLRLYQILQSKSKVAELLGIDERTIRKTIQKVRPKK